VCFVLQSCAPGVQGVVNDEPVTQHFVVVSYRRGEAERNGIEACGLRSQVEPRRVRTANDCGQPRQGRVVELVLLEEGIEAAKLADMVSSTPGISYGMAPVCLATLSTWSAGT